jgi:drug/metabolite transporter (DMT)-like permease
MNWIVVGLLMIASSVVLYLMLRKCSLAGIPNSLQNLAQFFIPFLIFMFMSYLDRTSLSVNLFQLLILAASAILFSYIGNRLLLSAISRAPNPGYSLTISKSYAAFTAIASVFLFGSELTVRSVMAIILIMVFATLIITGDRTKAQDERNPADTVWIWYSLGAFFAFGCLALSSKYMLDIGVSVLGRLVYVMAIVTVILFADTWKYRQVIYRRPGRDYLLLICIGIASASFNYFMMLGYDLAPNIGYINAMNASSIALVTLGSVLLYRDELSFRKFTGVVGVIMGLALLVV